MIHLTRLLIEKKDAAKAIELLDEVIAHAVTPTPLLLQKAAIIRETSRDQGRDQAAGRACQTGSAEPPDPGTIERRLYPDR